MRSRAAGLCQGKGPSAFEGLVANVDRTIGSAVVIEHELPSLPNVARQDLLPDIAG
jgi:hypothetical protein